VVKLETVKTLQSISRVNRQRAISVTANLAPGASQATALAEAERIARDVLPAGYTFNLEGGAKTFKESFSSLWFRLPARPDRGLHGAGLAVQQLHPSRHRAARPAVQHYRRAAGPAAGPTSR
jgi:hypothetical protein